MTRKRKKKKCKIFIGAKNRKNKNYGLTDNEMICLCSKLKINEDCGLTIINKYIKAKYYVK